MFIGLETTTGIQCTLNFNNINFITDHEHGGSIVKFNNGEFERFKASRIDILFKIHAAYQVMAMINKGMDIPNPYPVPD